MSVIRSIFKAATLFGWVRADNQSTPDSCPGPLLHYETLPISSSQWLVTAWHLKSRNTGFQEFSEHEIKILQIPFIKLNLPGWWLFPITTMIISASLVTNIDHGAGREEHLKLVPRWDKEIWGEAGFIFQPADIKRLHQQLAVNTSILCLYTTFFLTFKLWTWTWTMDLDATFTFWTQRLTLETWDPSDI